MDLLIAFAMLVVGFYMLGKGADLFVDGAAALAADFGIPALVIGLTIVAMGSSAPEAAVSITAALGGNADISVGNVVGSNIINVFIILGVASAITPLLVAQSTARIEMPFMIATTALLYVLGLDGKISMLDGLVMWIFFLTYLGYLYWMAKNGTCEAEDIEPMGMGKASFFMVGGLAVILGGSKLTVMGATDIATYLGLSERFIALTIVALGTSLPEMFISIFAAIKGQADLAIGNIVGSCVFNILFVLGTSSMIIDIPFAIGFVMDCLVAIASCILLWLFVLRDNRLHRWSGLVMIACYVGYLWYIF